MNHPLSAAFARTIRSLPYATGAAVLLVGCSTLLPVSSSPPVNGCLFQDVQVPARMFYVDAPATASAGATFSLTPWICRYSGDRLATPSMKAIVDDAARTITVTGQVERKEMAPGSTCLISAIYVPPRIATLSLDLALPVGTYSLLIATDSFLPELPSLETGQESGLPSPQASRTIEIL
ncbi:hypothetical protein J7643_00840 [bacterium]|nr:hypothetical protein [bacterium]